MSVPAVGNFLCTLAAAKDGVIIDVVALSIICHDAIVCVYTAPTRTRWSLLYTVCA